MSWLADQLRAAVVLGRAGVLRPPRPDRLARALLAVRRYGLAPAAGYAAAAARFPGRPALVDERGTLTFAELHRRTNAIANGLAAAGIRAGDTVGLVCRNHRGFVEATAAVAKLGAHALYLNTAFAAPQLADVVAREGARALVFDEEFADVLPDGLHPRFVAWHDGPVDLPTLEDLARGDASDPPVPRQPGRTVLLTSGTTGTPKGAARGTATSAGPAVALLSRIPLRSGGTTVIAAPLFHAWGFGHLMLGLLLGSTAVMRRRFDPEAVLGLVARHRADNLVVVPVMLQRILDLPREVRRGYDTASLRTVCSSGSALPGALAIRVMDELGDVLYNLYGSTEVAWATIATPADLRAAPGTAGRPPDGTVVRILDAEGHEVRTGAVGRVFVSNEMLFDGYTGGGGKEIVGELMSTGDVGHVDAAGRLFVDGREDDMVVSGGENVFPGEVEDLLARHPAVADVAVVGVPDPTFGQRLKAFVVPSPGAALTEDEVRAYVRESLARFKVPREVEFVGTIPRNPTGKILRDRLPPS